MLYRKNFTAEKDILTKRYVGVCTVNKERYVTIKSISTKKTFREIMLEEGHMKESEFNKIVKFFKRGLWDFLQDNCIIFTENCKFLSFNQAHLFPNHLRNYYLAS